MTETEQLQLYVERYFVRLNELAELAGTDADRIRALIAARAIPGPIYSIWPNGTFSSPIGGEHNGPAEGEAQHWYHPAAAWWIRRAASLDPEYAARQFQAKFLSDFRQALLADPYASLGYPQAFRNGEPDDTQIDSVGIAELNDWLDGGYGVCLRIWDGHHVVTKTCRRAGILHLTEEGRKSLLSAEDRLTLLDTMEALDAVMLPFAPHQRPKGTPGLWLDTILARYAMGTTREVAPI
ncbi:MAG: DUF6058 family natural product biosynthesis protein [Candidatus Devosia phytovorans]|uniref:DUF6058 family natural product biosynthesis protein n=1 Tax=Candidatus Devosia phytovorans TaxID=3121372 RepID=A0AAJ6B1R0_9HYPH|nr:DUF6058 family natural product biosynthesis protein [Devosia sp.]WEK04673.1 MAG: DUF6058 family natural product biosynthesis protein [Devosia sp.]